MPRKRLPFLAKAGVFLLGLAALGYIELGAIAQPLSALAPELLVEPDVVDGEPNAVVMWLWNALPVFSRPSMGTASLLAFGKRAKTNGIFER